jgi:hypothetical protein
VVLLPDRDTLLVVGSEDPDGLAWALEGAQECLDEMPRSLNGCPLRLRDCRWEPLRVLGGHPVLPLLRRAERRRLSDEYAHQKNLLDRRHDALGKAINVVPFRLEKTASIAVWSRPQGESWLPKADRVGLDLPGVRADVPWERLQEHVEPVAGLFPERFRFTGTPQVERLLA